MDLHHGGAEVKRNTEIIEALLDVTNEAAGIGHDLAHGLHLGTLKGHTARHNEADIAGAEDHHGLAHHIALAVDQLLGGTGAVNACRTGAADIEGTAAALTTAHGQHHGAGLDLQNTLTVAGGDHAVGADGGNGGFGINFDLTTRLPGNSYAFITLFCN